jgi:hypothetical protein
VAGVLPDANRAAAARLLPFLAACAARDSGSAAHLAIAFGPALLRPRRRDGALRGVLEDLPLIVDVATKAPPAPTLCRSPTHPPAAHEASHDAAHEAEADAWAQLIARGKEIFSAAAPAAAPQVWQGVQGGADTAGGADTGAGGEEAAGSDAAEAAVAADVGGSG